MPYDLERFIVAQDMSYDIAVRELKNGYKSSHWMWYIFPQFRGLGYSNRTEFYAIKSIEEAKAYLAHPILGERLIACARLLLDIKNRSIGQILGYPDDLKLKSSMTLFDSVSDETIFNEVLERYFNAERDSRTLEFIKA